MAKSISNGGSASAVYPGYNKYNGCTSWVKYRAGDILGKSLATWGHSNWRDKCSQYGGTYIAGTGGSPSRGDILLYNATASNPYGHVAVVESGSQCSQTNSDGLTVGGVTYDGDKIYITGYDWAPNRYGYVHFGDGSGGDDDDDEPDGWWEHGETGWQWDQSLPGGLITQNVKVTPRTVYRYYDYDKNAWSELSTTKPD